MINKEKIDRLLLVNVILLTVFGIIAFLSASLGLLAKEGAQYSSVVLNQITFGLIGGSIAAFICSKIPYRFWRTYSFWFFLASVILTLLVFTPLGFEFGGAKRWISIGSLSFQPGEILKIAYLIYLATWLSAVKDKIKTFKYGLIPFIAISAIAGGILMIQPDTDTAIIMLFAGGVILFASGAKFRHIILTAIIAIIAVTPVIISRPYIIERISTFLNPASNPLSSGYQIQQSLIAIGSGGLTGRGFGQSIQKFNFLPEPIGDSIFSVIAEEFGLIGSIILILLFTTFLIQSIRISLVAKDTFGGLLILGLAILIVSQSFLNMASMLGIFPLSGLPLLFVSHGGTALFLTLASTGIMFNISKYKKQI
jgi:cell division protein FtsW